jgi:anti-anti-sigma regulatory factor
VLKITVTEMQTANRWVLQGQLVGPWVRELRRCWKEAHTAESQKGCVIDLDDVTFIDKSGERLLRAMSKTGAELTSNGMYTKHLLEKLKARRSSLPSSLL